MAALDGKKHSISRSSLAATGSAAGSLQRMPPADYGDATSGKQLMNIAEQPRLNAHPNHVVLANGPKHRRSNLGPQDLAPLTQYMHPSDGPDWAPQSRFKDGSIKTYVGGGTINNYSPAKNDLYQQSGNYSTTDKPNRPE